MVKYKWTFLFCWCNHGVTGHGSEAISRKRTNGGMSDWTEVTLRLPRGPRTPTTSMRYLKSTLWVRPAVLYQHNTLLFDVNEAPSRSCCVEGNRCLRVRTGTGQFGRRHNLPSVPTVLRLTFPDPLKWNSPPPPRLFFHFKQCVAGKLDVSPSNPSSLRSHQAKVGVVPLLHYWCVGQRRHWAPSHTPPFSQSAHSHSSHKSLKRAPDFNAWHLHQYWCGRKVFQRRLSHKTLILIVVVHRPGHLVSLQNCYGALSGWGLKGNVVAGCVQRRLGVDKSPRVLCDKLRRTLGS